MKTPTKIGPVLLATMTEDETESLAETKAAIAAGNSVNELDREGRTPIFYAAKKGFNSVVHELMTYGAKLNIQDRNGENLLHFMAREFRPDLAQLFIEHGVDVNAQDKYGSTPLFRAVYYARNRGEIIRLFLSHGADKYKENYNGVSPIILANRIASHDARQFLKDEENSR